MAGDWIPMRLDLREDPAVICMSERLECEPDLVVGLLHRVWSWASQQSEDGNVANLRLTSIGRLTRTDFIEAMSEAGWIVDTGDGVLFPNFDRWMGQSAKKRLGAARRQQKLRVTQASQNSVTNVAKVSQESDGDVSKCESRKPISRTLRSEVRKRDNDTCQYCGWKKGDRSPFGTIDLHIDHVLPDCQEGPEIAENLVVACSRCNMEKGGRTPSEAGMKLLPTCHESVTSFCDKNVTTVQKRRGENNKPPAPRGANRFDASLVELPATLATCAFRESWAQWVSHRRQIGHKLTEATTEKQLAKLAKLGPAAAIETINHSIENGWQGLFPPKAGQAQTAPEPTSRQAPTIKEQAEEARRRRAAKAQGAGR